MRTKVRLHRMAGAVLLVALLLLGPGWPGETGLADGPPPGEEGAATSGDLAEATARVDFALKSEAAVLMDVVTGQVLYAKEPHKKWAPASLTKILTLALACEALAQGKVKPDDMVVASENAWEMGGSEIWLEPGEEMPFSDLLLAVAVGSANDAAVAVAEYLAGSEQKFVEWMNEKARALGCKDTHFVNCHGLDDEGHLTTAYDLALISRYALGLPEVVRLSTLREAWIRQNTAKKSWLVSRNRLLVTYPGATGLKTGHTSKAQYCLVGSARRDERQFLAVILGAPDPATRVREATQLLNYAFATFTPVVAARGGEEVARVRVVRGKERWLPAVAAGDLALSVEKDRADKVQKVIEVVPRANAPVRAGDELGIMALHLDGKELARVALVAARDVPRSTLLGAIGQTIARFFSVR
ncbi:MAG: D-alanyl-D-alanine carboxypeptidase family protein [Bacillota bacterium]|nr:D-alanyl-D-alanine carboxypeptidase family protein [Bacillota bacterium]